MPRPKQIQKIGGTPRQPLQIQANGSDVDSQRWRLESFTVVGLPAATTGEQIVYVSNESGGAVPAFSDGTNWRRVTDRVIVT